MALKRMLPHLCRQLEATANIARNSNLATTVSDEVTSNMASLAESSKLSMTAAANTYHSAAELQGVAKELGSW